VRTASIIRDDPSLMMEAVRTSETSVDNHFTRQYNPEDNPEHHKFRHIPFNLSVGIIPPRSLVRRTV
jgi:hypothetical protein